MANGYLDNFNQVEKNLYIGDILTSINYKTLTQYNITHILVCGEELSCRYPNEFTYMHIPIRDTPSTSIREYFEEVFMFISKGQRKGSVLVHCAQARSRSASMVLSYLMKSRQVKYKKALEILKKNHPQAEPNPGFRNQLIQYEKEVAKPSGCMSTLF
ncbi:hypothetical protein SteCoe_17309 [Stentor coeruleus]|uniref:Protein-tyrosine-phosphatase n=1 Tax=Stentor coeruleus TaxID=5963 RepID=A0A1R2BZ90_9CILI|nr:hypothetical protein SteCoe_17309 [Stentor coeruleus]